MKKITLCIILFLCLILNGCQSYNDVNKLLFVTTVIVDVDAYGKPVLYLEAFKPTKQSTGNAEKGERLLFRGTGKTIFEAIRDVHLSSSLEFNYTQNKIVLYTERAAAKGIDNYLDVFDRGQEFLVRPYIAVLHGDPEEFLKADFKGEEYMGIYLRDLIDNEGSSSRAVRLTINEYFTNRLIGSKTNIVTVVALKSGQMQEIIEVRGGAIIKDNKMVEFMPREDGLGYNFLMNRLDMGSLEITNPDYKNSFVTLRILNSKTNTDLSYDGEVIHLNKKVKLKTSIADVQKQLGFENQEINNIRARSIQNINDACNRVFKKYKDMNLDIFEVKEEFQRRYPKVKLEDPLKITELNIEVEENIEGSPDKLEFPK